jgi:hypothetical protein
VTDGKRLADCYGDIGIAAADMGSVLSGDDPSNDGLVLAHVVRSRLEARYGVVLVGHSRGTLVAQEAIQQLKKTAPASLDLDNCVGFVSIASPLWDNTIRSQALLFGTIAKGTYVEDVMFMVPGSRTYSPPSTTVLTKQLDAQWPHSLMAWFKWTSAVQVHAFDHYMSPEGVRSDIQSHIESIGAAIQATCRMRTVAGIAVTSGDNATGTVNSTLTSPAVFTVTDAAGRPVQGITVHFVVESGSLVGPADAVTTADGTVSVAVRTGSAAGAAVLAATVAGTTLAAARLHVTVVLPSTAPQLALSRSAVLLSAQVGSGAPITTSLLVTNSGSGVISGLSVGSINYGSGEPTNWLATSLSGSSTPATLTVSATIGALSVGTYSATFSVSSSAPNVLDNSQSVTATLIVSATAAAPTLVLDRTAVPFVYTVGGTLPGLQSIHITNSGSGSLTGLSIGTVSYAAGQPVGWLTPSLSAQTAPASISFVVSPSVLPPATYTATLSVASSAAGVTNSPLTVAVTLVVSAAAATTGSIGLVASGLPPGPDEAGGGTCSLDVSDVRGPSVFAGPYRVTRVAQPVIQNAAIGQYTIRWNYSTGVQSGLFYCQPSSALPTLAYRVAPATDVVTVSAGSTVASTVSVSLDAAVLRLVASGLPNGYAGIFTVRWPSGATELVNTFRLFSGGLYPLNADGTTGGPFASGSYTVLWQDVVDGAGRIYHPSPAAVTVSLVPSTTPIVVSTTYAP